MALYKQEFGNRFELGFDLSQFPMLNDRSWHNDVCPSFWFKDGDQYLILWVDYKPPADREYEQERYVIMTAENEGTDAEPEVFTHECSEIAFKCEEAFILVEHLKTKAADNHTALIK